MSEPTVKRKKLTLREELAKVTAAYDQCELLLEASRQAREELAQQHKNAIDKIEKLRKKAIEVAETRNETERRLNQAVAHLRRNTQELKNALATQKDSRVSYQNRCTVYSVIVGEMHLLLNKQTTAYVPREALIEIITRGEADLSLTNPQHAPRLCYPVLDEKFDVNMVAPEHAPLLFSIIDGGDPKAHGAYDKPVDLGVIQSAVSNIINRMECNDKLQRELLGRIHRLVASRPQTETEFFKGIIVEAQKVTDGRPNLLTLTLEDSDKRRVVVPAWQPFHGYEKPESCIGLQITHLVEKDMITYPVVKDEKTLMYWEDYVQTITEWRKSEDSDLLSFLKTYPTQNVEK